MTNYTDRMKFAQEMMTIAESTIAIVEHFRKLQSDGFILISLVIIMII